MQAFLPLMPGIQSAQLQVSKRQARNLLYPCTAVAARDKLYCYLQITDRILPRVGYDWRVASSWCRRAEKRWIATCFQSLGRDGSRTTHEDPAQIERLCRLAGAEADQCLYGAVRDVTSNDPGGARAAKLCTHRTALGSARCSGAIGSILGGLATTRAGRRGLSAGVAPPRFRRACFDGAGAS